MSVQIVVLALAVLLTGGLLHVLPGLTRPDIFFAVTVEPEFRRSPEARRVFSRYRAMVWGFTAAAFALGVAAGMWMVGLLLQIFGVMWALVRGHREVFPYRVAPATVVEVDLSALPERLPGGPLVAALPLISLAALGVWMGLRFDTLPPRFPIHWGIHGANGWVHATPTTVMTFLAVQASLCLLMIGLAWGVLNWSRRISTVGASGAAERNFRRRAVQLLIASAYLMAALAWLPILGANSAAMHFVTLAFPAVILVFTVLLVRAGQGGTHAATTAPAPVGDRTPDACWKWGLIYINSADPAIFVEKRFGIGYTLNFGNHWSWLVLGLLLAPLAVVLIFLPHRT